MYVILRAQGVTFGESLTYEAFNYLFLRMQGQSQSLQIFTFLLGTSVETDFLVSTLI